MSHAGGRVDRSRVTLLASALGLAITLAGGRLSLAGPHALPEVRVYKAPT